MFRSKIRPLQRRRKLRSRRSVQADLDLRRSCLFPGYSIIRGTNTGLGADGSEPTGRTISFKGASIIRVEGDKIRSDNAYFDRKALDEQLAPK